MKHKIYLDAETNGLNDVTIKDGKEFIGAKEYKMIEIGIVLTDMQERVIDIFESQIKISMKDINQADPWCMKAHTKTGLYDKCLAHPDETKVVEEKIINFLDKNNVDKRALLSGQSAHFDKEFIKYQMPSLFNRLNHQTFDISTLRYHYEDKYAGVMKALADIKEDHYNHTALNDIAFSLISGRVYSAIADGDLSKGDELNDDDISLIQFIKNSVLDDVRRYRLNQTISNAHEVEITNFAASENIISIASTDKDSLSDDVTDGYEVSFDMKLDVQTSVNVSARIPKDSNLNSSDVSVKFLKSATKDTLRDFIENKETNYGFGCASRTQELIEFTRTVLNEIGNNKNAKLSINNVPNILQAYLSGNALEHRKDTYVASHKNTSSENTL